MDGLSEAEMDDCISLDELFCEELKFHQNLLPNIFRIPDTVINETWMDAVLNNENESLLVSEYQGKIVGAILYKITTSSDDIILEKRKYGYIEEMIVTETLRGKGIGKQLLDYAIEDLKGKDIKEIEINVWEKNEGGLRFYERYGFGTIRRRLKMEIG
jgi:ribosomal protein S18 acetylase RimI-like enzyme